MKKAVVPIIIIVIVIAAVFYRIDFIQAQGQEKKLGIENIQEENGYPVTIESIQKGPFELWRDLPGKVEGFRQAAITTPDAARVDKIRYRVGDAVRANTPIISLDEDDPKNISKVKLLRTVYENALQEYERYKNLYESGGISKDVLDKFYLKLKETKTNLDSAKATVHLTAPFDGVLIALYIREGEYAEPGKTLALVSYLKTVRINAAISDRDYPDFKVGQPVAVKTPAGTVLNGTVDRLSLGANLDSGLFDLELKVDNPEHELKVGMYMTASVRIFHVDDVYSINSQAILLDENGKEYVFQLEGMKARRSPVKVIMANDSRSVIELDSPELPVVLEGSQLLREGSRVTVIEKDTK